MTRSMPWMKRSGPDAELKSSSRPRICQPSAAITSRLSALPATAAHATEEPLASGLDRGLGGAGCLVAVVVGGAGRRSALAMDREVPDARMLAAHRALRIAPKLDLAEAHAEGVVGQEPADQRLADAKQHLDGLGRLHHSDHAWEHAQDAGLASGGHEARRRRSRIEAAVAGALSGREDRGHALELEDRAVDVGLARD